MSTEDSAFKEPATCEKCGHPKSDHPVVTVAGKSYTDCRALINGVQCYCTVGAQEPADPPWLTEAVDALALADYRQWTEHPEIEWDTRLDDYDYEDSPAELRAHYVRVASANLSACLPIIRAGIEAEVLAARRKLLPDIGKPGVPVGLAAVCDGFALAARIVRGSS